MLPVPWRKATWLPRGAGGLPEVKALLLPETPALPPKVQGEPAGLYWKLPLPTGACSNPGSGTATLTPIWAVALLGATDAAALMLVIVTVAVKEPTWV